MSLLSFCLGHVGLTVHTDSAAIESFQEIVKQQAILSVYFYHSECLIQFLLVSFSVNNARPQLCGFWLWFLPTPIEGNRYFKLSIASHENQCKWREAWLSEITKTRVMDQDFRNQITSDKVYTSDKHFDSEDIELCK